MEFMAVRVPVVVSSTKIDQFYFDQSVVRFFESGNVDAMAGAMLEVLIDSNLRSNLVARAFEYVARKIVGKLASENTSNSQTLSAGRNRVHSRTSNHHSDIPCIRVA